MESNTRLNKPVHCFHQTYSLVTIKECMYWNRWTTFICKSKLSRNLKQDTGICWFCFTGSCQWQEMCQLACWCHQLIHCRHVSYQSVRSSCLLCKRFPHPHTYLCTFKNDVWASMKVISSAFSYPLMSYIFITPTIIFHHQFPIFSAAQICSCFFPCLRFQSAQQR